MPPRHAVPVRGQDRPDSPLTGHTHRTGGRFFPPSGRQRLQGRGLPLPVRVDSVRQMAQAEFWLGRVTDAVTGRRYKTFYHLCESNALNLDACAEWVPESHGLRRACRAAAIGERAGAGKNGSTRCNCRRTSGSHSAGSCNARGGQSVRLTAHV